MPEIRPVLMLTCKLCEWRPPETSPMADVEMHFKVEHDNADLALNLSVICTECAAIMEFVESRPTGGGFKDHHLCPNGGSTGYIKRRQ